MAPPCATATGKYYIISGQHRFQAAQQTAKKAAEKALPAPSWTQRFRCHVVKADTSVETRQIIAGKTQALQESVHGMPFSDKVRWLRREMVAELQALEEKGEEYPQLNRAALLRLTYTKTGCTPSTDGSMVCVCKSLRNYAFRPFPWCLVPHMAECLLYVLSVGRASLCWW